MQTDLQIFLTLSKMLDIEVLDIQANSFISNLTIAYYIIQLMQAPFCIYEMSNSIIHVNM